MTELYRAGGQLLKVRGVMLLVFAAALFSCVAGWWAFNSMIDESGEPASLSIRLGIGIGIPLLFIPMAAGMVAYGRHYVARVRFDPKAERLHFQTVTQFGTHERVHTTAQITGSERQAGAFSDPLGQALSVAAPYHKVRISGHTWPLILDAQGKFVDEPLARKLLKLD